MRLEIGRTLRVELRPHGTTVGVAYYLFLNTPMVTAGEHSPVVLLGLRQSQPSKDAAHVLLHCPLSNPELVRDAGVRTALSHEREHLPLTCCEVLKEMVTAAGRDKPAD